MVDDDPLLWQLLLQLLLIVLNAAFACAEIAVITINDNKLAKLAAEGDKRAVRLLGLTEQPARFLSVIQVGITFAGFLASAFAAENFSKKLVGLVQNTGLNIPENTLRTVSIVVITLVLSYFTLVFGELVPKRVAMRYAEQISLAMSGLICFIAQVFAPIVWLLTISTNAVLRLLRIDPNAEDEHVTEEEIRIMVDVGTQKGAIDDEEREFINNLFDFDDTPADEVMTHRTDVSLLWMEETVEQWDETINESAHSIYPVCGKDADDVIGVLYAKDYFRLKDKDREQVITNCIKPAYFVPETVRMDVLFRNMKKNKNHFAVVLDEYGGMSGIITMNDLLEELLGDLEDDASAPEELPLIERIDSQTWKIRGAASLEAVSSQMGIKLPDDEYGTFGGLVFGMLGSVPDDGSTAELEIYGMNVKITEIREHRLESAIVCIAED